MNTNNPHAKINLRSHFSTNNLRAKLPYSLHKATLKAYAKSPFFTEQYLTKGNNSKSNTANFEQKM